VNNEIRDRILQDLSPAQRDVVSQLHHGPVKVVAAAGSGKTRTMAALYAIALLEGITPGQILAVTFTKKGAAELRERVARTVATFPSPPDLDFAWIGTFHQLMYRLLAEHWYEAGVGPELAQLDEIEARQLMQEVGQSVRRKLADGELGPLPRLVDGRDLLRIASSAEDAVRRLRSTPLSPRDCLRLSTSAYGAPPFNADPGDELALHRLGLRLTQEVWVEYERRLAALNATDFDGLLRTALRALRTAPSLRAWTQQNFRMVIVDEYQDTSPLQVGLLAELWGHNHERSYVVGDPRQSIYAFRDAQPGVMEEHPGRLYPLAQNYRSLSPILSAAEAVLRTEPQFADDRPMEVGRLTPDGHPVMLGLASHPRLEAEGIADLIRRLHDGGLVHPDGSAREVRYQDVAILARTLGRIGPHLENALRARGIPFATAAGGLLERPEVKDAVALLRAAVNPLDGQAWVRVLQGPLFRVADHELALIMGRPQEEEVPVPVRLRRSLDTSSASPPLRRRTEAALDLVAAGAVAAELRSGSEVLSLLMERSGMRAYHDARRLRGEADGARALASLEALNRVALEAERGGRFVSARQLVSRIDRLEERGGRREPAPAEGDQVTISTIHGAKGLEWPVVVLADCRPFHARSGPGPVLWDEEAAAVVVTTAGGSPTAAKGRWQSSRAARVDREERTRLIYVGMTRAQDLLVVTTTRAWRGSKGATLDEVVAEAWQGPRGAGEFGELVAGLAAGAPWVGRLAGFPDQVVLPWETVSGSGPAPASGRPLMSLQAAVARWRQVEGLAEAVWDHGQRPRPEVSYSALETLERCPRWYWFEQVAQFRVGGLEEGEARDAPRTGIAAHRVLERFHRRNPDRGPRPGELAEMARRSGPSSCELEAMLENYAKLPVAALPTLGVEVRFKWRGWGAGDLPDLVGAIDRVALTERGEAMVIDYKTDRMMTAASRERHGRQLLLYSMAVERGLLGNHRVAPPSLIMVRSGEVVEVDSSAASRDEALSWAMALARRAAEPEALSAVGHSALPCAECPYQWFCPERSGVAGRGQPLISEG
jgi:DNA helicase-2/ATP-dependent DNA helicase PcrA